MLRPATPLTILLFISFVLLLLSTISTPIVKNIALARFVDNGEGTNYGVFGWCKDNGECSGIHLGYRAPNNTQPGAPALSADGRHTLTSLLIVHPIAAFCNLIVLGLAIAAHLHSPSHSARYLLGLLILLLPTLLVTLLAFLVDILLFVPRLQWAGWIVLASTILITASGVVTCAMRRTLVSRKARKKRIAENAEMSGANFYARQAEETRMATLNSTESKTPMVNGAPGADTLPSFATLHTDDLPGTAISPEPTSANTPVDGRYYGAAAAAATATMPTPRSRSNSRPRPEDLGSSQGWSEDRPPMPGSVPPPNRGGYGPRGGYLPRGGPSSRGSFNGRGPPPAGYRGRGGYPSRGRGAFMPGAMGPGPGMEHRRPPPGYGPQPMQSGPEGYGPPPVNTGIPYNNQPSHEPYSPSNYGTEVTQGVGGLAYGARAQSPAHSRRSPYGSRAQSPATGRPSADAMPPMPMPNNYDNIHHQRRGTAATGMTVDSDVLGAIEGQRVRPQNSQRIPSGEYVPPRSAWNANQSMPPVSPASSSRRKRINSSNSDYMEDVDPRFAEQPPMPQPNHDEGRIPSLLVAGHTAKDPSPESSSSQINNKMPRTSSYDELAPGAQSPVESEISNFTSVSQRPVNQNWQPGYGGEFNSFGPAAARPQAQQQRRHDVLLNNNPDFELPGPAPSRGRGGYRGRGSYGRPPPARNQAILDVMGGDGRYPAGPPSGSVREI